MTSQKFWDTSSSKMPHFWGNVVFFLLWPIMWIFRLNAKNKDSLRKLQGKTGVLMISNHTSYLDVFCQYLCVRLKQYPRFVARDSLYNNKLLGFFLTRCGAIPIKRDSADRIAIKRAAKLLKEGDVVGIMPEGTRRYKSGKKPSLHAGAAFIARLGGNVPILPVTTINAEKVKQKGKWLRFPKITVEFGNPILLSDFDFVDKEDRLEAITWYAIRESFAMFQSCTPQDVDMVDLFPETKDYSKLFEQHPIPAHTSDEIVKLLRQD